MTVLCPACRFENPDGFAFCGKCGAKLSVTCPHCGADLPPGFAFCGKCGARIAPPEAAPSAPLVTAADLTRLARYLPPDALDRFPPAALWQDSHVAQAQTELTHLLARIVPYLPRYLVQAELAQAGPAPVGGEFLSGALLFSDISGFTAMSERLSMLGKEGAEQLVALVNRYFGAMLDVLGAHGGDLFKFGGDALLAYFPDAPEVPGSVNALHAAWAMQQAMTAFHQVQTSLGVFPLQMKIGLHAGTFFAARVGDADEREFIITGDTVNATARAESAAVAGQILLSDAVQAQIQPHPAFQTIPVLPGYHLLTGLTPSLSLPLSPSPLLPLSPTLSPTLTALECLTPYLPSGLLPRLVSDVYADESAGEHRLVAVLFANFVGASELVARLGPGREADIAAALNVYFVAMHQAVARYGGVVNKVDLYDHGDKLMALFGAPVAHEDDAERAVRAALEMQRALESEGEKGRQGEGETFPPSPPPPLSPSSLWKQRIGVSTGMVFAGLVGGAARREYTVMGDEVNLAARLMSAADEGGLLLSGYVERKVRAFFEVADRGAVQLKGKSKPVPTYTVVGRRAQPEPVRGIRGLRSALVGRAAEQATLRNLVADLYTGRGAILSLIGEAGLGKSRLMADLRDSVYEEIAMTWIEGRCLSYTQQISYSAFNDVIRSALGILDTDNEFDIRDKLRRYVETLLPADVGDDVRPYLVHFLNLPLSEREAERVAYLDGEALQRQIVRAITTLLEAVAREQPLVLVFDDLHWADSASLMLLERCMALTDRVPLLLVLIYRPLRGHGCWALGDLAARDYPHRYTRLSLTPLRAEAGQDRQLVCNLLSLDALPPALEQLIARAEGNPFYIEEIIRTLIDQAIIVSHPEGWRLERDLDLHTIPDTLQGLIVARLDQLMEEARRTLQLAAVVGRAFRYEMLAWLASAAALAATLDTSLARLQQAELIREHARLPEVAYIFKHVLVHDVAYESLLLRDRRAYHGLVAQHLEDVVTGQKREEVYEVLAYHYGLSDYREKALDYLTRSGDKARAAYANPEAIAFYRQAARLAEQSQQWDAFADVLTGLGDVLFHTGESDEALACYEQALSRRQQPAPQADLLRRIAAIHEKRGDYEQALAACTRGMALLPAEAAASVEMARLMIARAHIHEQQGQNEAARQESEASLTLLTDTTHYREIVQAHNVLGLSLRSNQPAKAIEHLEQAMHILERIGDDYEAAKIYNNLAILYYQTDLNRAADYFQNALRTMQRLGNVWEEATAYMNLGIIYYTQGNYAQAIENYEYSLHITERLGDKQGLSDCYVNLGETYRAQGNLKQAIEYLERSLAVASEIGAEATAAECQRQLAECYLENGEYEKSLAICREALAGIQGTGEFKIKGDLYHVMGNAYHKLRELEVALSHLEKSIGILRELNQDFDLAAVLSDYGQVLKDAAQPAAARAALTEALTLFERLELSQEQERVRAALNGTPAGE
ncbi:MAG TPA: adenylate/guanylate cyclase domain-containing protein [Anaerolineae bacterium]|nr:adenylate/guanylate cyclase domain-containing protein [Anaerolineae bacterium]